MDQNYKKLALITGSTSGLGVALCKRLCEDGYRVVGNYLSHEKAEWLRGTLDDMGCKIDLVKGNVADYQAVGRMIETVTKEIGPIDILVNNASQVRNISFLRMDKADWEETINTNLNGIFNCSHHVIKGMMQQRYGRIINVCSIHARKASNNQTGYAAARAGIHGFTQSLAREVAPYGITVNTISPDYTNYESTQLQPELDHDTALTAIPVGRQGVLEDIAEMVSYLISGKSGFITGYNMGIGNSRPE